MAASRADQRAGARHVAIVTPHGIQLLDLADGERRSLLVDSDEVVGSLEWLSADELGYASYRWPHGPEGLPSRRFWRQHIDQPMEQRSLIHHDADVSFAISQTMLRLNWDREPNEFWSPNGRWVLFRGADGAGEAHLLEIENDEMWRLRNGVPLHQASWSRDGSKVFWYGSERGREELPQAFLLDIATGELQELSEPFGWSFGQMDIWLDSRWTLDGRFICGDSLWLGGILIQLQPWSVRNIGKAVAEKRGDPEADPMQGTVLPTIRGQPAEDRFIVSGAGPSVVVNSTGEIVHELGAPGLAPWTVLPDGTQAVSIGISNGNIEVRSEPLP